MSSFSVAFDLAYIVEFVNMVLEPAFRLKLTFMLFRMGFLSTNRYSGITRAKTILVHTLQISTL